MIQIAPDKKEDADDDDGHADDGDDDREQDMVGRSWGETHFLSKYFQGFLMSTLYWLKEVFIRLWRNLVQVFDKY